MLNAGPGQTSDKFCSASGEYDIRNPKVNVPVTRELPGGQIHFYKFFLPANVYAHAAIDQLGIDVRVSVFTCGTDGRAQTIHDVDRQSGSRGPENISFITGGAHQSGIYFLRVEAFQSTDLMGRYMLRMSRPRAPRPNDLVRIDAEGAVTRGGDLYNKGGNENLPRDERRKIFEESISEFERGRKLWRSLNEPYEEAIALYGIGYCYSDLGALGTVKFPLPAGRLRWSYQSREAHVKAIEAFQESSSYMKRSRNKYGQAITSAGIAWPQLYLGLEKEARQSFSDAFDLFHVIKNTKGQGRALYGQGWAYAIANENQKALDSFLRALPLRKESGETTGVAITHASICRVYNRLGKNEEAIEHCRQALVLFKGRKHGTASTLSVRGFAYAALGQQDRALDDFQEALRLRIDLKDSTGEANARYGMALVYRSQKRLPEALAQMDLVLKIVEPLRSVGSSGDLRTYFFANVQEYYELYIDLLMSMGLETKALEASERARARELLATLAEAEDNVQKIDPSWGHTLDATEIKQLLDDDTLLLEFALGDKRSFVWLVSNQNIQAFELPPGADLETKALEVHRLLMIDHKRAGTDGERFDLQSSEKLLQSMLGQLSQMLLKPLAGRLGNNRLVVVAPGALQYVPFGVLRASQRGLDVSENSAPLAADHEIAYLPSASILFALRQRSDRYRLAPKTIAILADPVFTPSDIRVRVVPRRKRNGSHLGRDKTSRLTVEREAIPREVSDPKPDIDLPRLDASRWEAEQIVSLAKGENNLLALDFTANRSKALKGELGLTDYRVVHFATHALVDDLNPILSRIMLSQVDEQGRWQNGSLTLRDIETLRLPAEIVVVSACRTGLGKRVKGEGLKGLTSSFMHAGASRVIVSLWRVNDDVTAQFMVKFYRRLLSNNKLPRSTAAAKALREAQEEMRADARWNAPYYWAPFILQGDWK